MIMQITAFKAILAQIINIKGCEDYTEKYTLARMESDCMLRFGFKAHKYCCATVIKQQPRVTY